MYKIKAPIGNYVVSKDVMTEEEIRTTASQLVSEGSKVLAWREKVKKDPIEKVVEWLQDVGYKIEKI